MAVNVNQTLEQAEELVYTPPGREKDQKNEPESVSWITESFTWLFLGVCLLVWAVVGFLLWIPRLLRSMARFSVALVQATITESSADEAARDLRSAADFYKRGFSGAIGAIRSTRGEQPEGGRRIEVGLIMREIAWALVFWYVVLWAMGVSVWTPADYWAAFGEVPWGEIWDRIAAVLAVVPETIDGFLTGA